MRQLVLLFILILYTISLNSWARKPAVEPQMGITNEFQPQPPSIAKGFEFKENVNRAPSSTDSSSTTATTFLVLILLGAPLLVWAGIQWKSKKSLTHSNVVNLRDHQQEDPTDWPKAS